MCVRRARLAAIIALIGCTPAVDPQLPPGAAMLTDATELLLAEQYSGIGSRRREVVRDAPTWSKFWAQAHGHIMPQPAVPSIDFTKNVVVVAAMGTRSSGGYVIDIESLYEANGDVFAVVTERSPGVRCVTTAALTAPVVAVRVARPGMQVSFVERSEINDC